MLGFPHYRDPRAGCKADVHNSLLCAVNMLFVYCSLAHLVRFSWSALCLQRIKWVTNTTSITHEADVRTSPAHPRRITRPHNNSFIHSLVHTRRPWDRDDNKHALLLSRQARVRRDCRPASRLQSRCPFAI